MIRDHWKDPRFWVWYWRTQLRVEAKLGGIFLLLTFVAIGGYYASGMLSTASAATSKADSYVLETTVTRIVTVRKNGKIVVKRIPVVVRKTVVRLKNAPPRTLVATEIVTAPGATRYLTRKIVRYVPVVRRRVIRVNGKTTTVTETRLVPTVKTQTLTNVVTNQQTVTAATTVVVPRTDTLVETDVRTVTAPPATVVETETEMETVVETETQTVTQEPITVTVTVPTTG